MFDGAIIDAWRLKKAQSTPKHPAPPPPTPQVVKNVVMLELKPLEGQTGRRLRVLPGDDILAGATYQIAAASSAENGLMFARNELFARFALCASAINRSIELR